MRIVDVDHRLFHVQEVLPKHLVESILNIDWINLPWNKGDKQETWLRRHITANAHPILAEIDEYLITVQHLIENHCSIKFYTNPYTIWWLDEPGFSCSLHTDGELFSSMQLFWQSSGIQYGTKFYNSKNVSDIKYDFPFIPNSGYLMLNQAENDYQILQWHGMPTIIPEYRLTSYTYFGNYR